MPNLKTQIDLIFQGINRTDQPSQDVLKNISLIGVGANAAIKPINQLTTFLIEAEKKALQLAFAIGKESVVAFANFDSARVDAEKFIDRFASEADFENFVKQIKDVSLSFGESASNSLRAGIEWVKAGKDGAEAVKLFALSLEAARAGEIDIIQATELVARITENFGITADEARKRLDLLNNVADNSSVTFGGLLEAFAPVSGVVAEFGLNFDEVISLLAVGSGKTREFNETGNALKALFVTLTRPTAQQIDLLLKLGVAQDEAGLRALTLDERFQKLKPALTDVTGAQREFAFALLGGKEQANRVIALIGDQAKANEILEKSYKSVNTVAKEAARDQEKLSTQLDRVRDVITRVQSAIGAELKTSLFEVSDQLVSLGEVLINQIGGDAFAGIFNILNDEFFELAEAIEQIKIILPEALEGVDTTKLEESLTSLFDAVENVFDIDLTSAEGLRDTIQLLADTFANLNNFAAGYIESKGPLVSASLAIAEAFSSMDAESAKALGGLGGFIEIFDKIVPDIETILIGFIAFKAGLLGTGAAAATAATSLATYGGGVLAAGGLAANHIFTFNELGNAVLNVAGEGRLPAVVQLMEKLGLIDVSKVRLELLAKDIDNIKETDPEAFLADLSQEMGEFSGVVDDVPLAKILDDLRGITNLDTRPFWESANDGSIALTEGLNALSDGLEVSNESFEESNKSIVEWREGSNKAFDTLNELANTSDAVGIAFDNTKDRFVEITQATLDLEGNTRKVISTYKDAEGNIIPVYESIGKAAGDGLGAAADAAEEAFKKTEKYQLKLLELENDKALTKIKEDAETLRTAIEGAVEINVAQIKADADKVIAAFDSINVGIESTGQTITDAFGLLANVDPLDRLDLLEFIRKEEARRQQAFEQQRRLVNSQIRVLDAQAARLQSKDPWFRIDGSGLETELKALMTAVLRFTQVNMIQTNADFLLGVNPFIQPNTP